MTLGETIRSIRSAKGMSQGDLADALDVSRQSVSKWETDASVPELDKLMKLCDLFGVTMDELVRGVKEELSAKDPEESAASPAEEIPPEPAPETPREASPKISTRQHVTGIILLCTSAVIFLMLTAMNAFLGGLIFASPFLACGVICVTQYRHVGLKCSWAVYFLVDAYLSYATGVSRGWVVSALRTMLQGIFDDFIRYQNPFTPIISIAMLLILFVLIVWTAVVCRKSGKKLLPRLIVFGCLLIVSLIASHFSSMFYMNAALNFHELKLTLGRFLVFLFDWVQITAYTGLLTLLGMWLYRRRHN
ncbi:MAG: helix-turn-helix transcriptional regulator [Clostridia bacterium]|nr:helix-turn-helix transcriptional regulator [Clostridia bacterium]